MKIAGLLLSAMLAIGAVAPKIEPQKKAEFNEPEGFSIYKWGTPVEVITGDYSGVHPDRRSGEQRGPREKFFRAGHAVGDIESHGGVYFPRQWSHGSRLEFCP